MSHPIGLQVLKAKLRGFQAAGTTISSRISTSKKERKHRLWNQKRLPEVASEGEGWSVLPDPDGISAR